MSPKSEQSSLPQLLRITEAAAKLAVSRSTLYQLMDGGTLSYVKLGKSRRIEAGEIDRLVSEHRVGPVPSNHPAR